jgi:signal transduction histidine kinase
MRVPKLVLIYLGTIVIPAGVLMWLGAQSFERQRQALAALTAEKLSTEMQKQLRQTAEGAFIDREHPIAKIFFRIQDGMVVQPALYSALPQPLPSDFSGAENQELALNRPDLALDSYRKLLEAHKHDALAMSRIARCLAKLGRDEEARSVWRTLAMQYPDERDLSHRPYGIVAAIAAGDTAGLYGKIESGRWELSADQAEYFLTQLDPTRVSPYLYRFKFARDLTEQFKPQGALGENELYLYRFGPHEIFYRAAAAGAIEGFEVDQSWVTGTLQHQVENEVGITASARQNQLVYGGAIALMLVIVSAGILLILRDASRESRTNQLRSDFVSSVSHELKTPITLIRLYSETLERHTLPEQQRSECHHIIVRESERLSRLVDQILTFSRIERASETYQLEKGDLAPVIARIVDEYRGFVERSGFTVRSSIAPLASQVRFDTNAVSKALLNLLDNAVKYSDESHDIEVRVNAEDKHILIEVQDHGIGIPHSEQQKIFERFYRVQNGSGKGGYGLGLFMVRHIMEAHGGRVEVESAPGQGSRFRLVFPVVHEWAKTASS